MKSLWQESVRDALKQRIAGIRADRAPLWGKMSAPEMVVHLNESMRMALGDLPVASKRLPIRYPPLKQLFVYCLPFPKSAPTAPELLEGIPTEWQKDVTALVALLNRFASRNPRDPWPEHPAFGRLSPRAWGVLGYKHMDHHLRQFGV